MEEGEGEKLELEVESSEPLEPPVPACRSTFLRSQPSFLAKQQQYFHVTTNNKEERAADWTAVPARHQLLAALIGSAKRWGFKFTGAFVFFNGDG